MNYVKKKIMLKGAASGVLTIEGSETARVNIEWLRGEVNEPVILFATPDVFTAAENGIAEIPAKTVSAAAVGKKLSARGQLMPFNWQKALANININAFLKASHEDASKAEQSTENPPETAEKERALSNAESQPNAAETTEDTEAASCPVKKQPKEVTAFSSAFPDSVWYEHEYVSTGSTRKYLTGVIYENGRAVKTAAAVPGQFSVKPPPWLEGFSMYILNDDRSGYWVSVSQISNDKS